MRASQTIGKWRTAYELSELYTATEEAAGKVTTMASEASDARNGECQVRLASTLY